MESTQARLVGALEAAIPQGLPVGSEVPPPEPPEIPGEALRRLLTAAEWESAPSPRLFLRNVRIVGSLDLDACQITARLRLEGCELTDTIYLEQACAPDIRILGCSLGGAVEGSQAKIDWNFWLDGSTIAGPIRLTNATIGAQLAMVGSTLNHEGPPGLPAFHGDSMEVGKGMYFRDRFTSCGQIRLVGTRVGGQLDFSEAEVRAPEGPAIQAPELSVEGSFLARRLRADGMRLNGASVRGNLELDGASFTQPGNGEGLCCSGIEVGGDVNCCDHFAVTGDVNLTGSTVRGDLALDRARIQGCLVLYGVEVGGQLGLQGAELTAPSEPVPQVALNGGFLTVGGGVHASDLNATGLVRLGQAKIAGHVIFQDADLNGGDSGEAKLEALSAPRLRVCDGFALIDSRVTGSIELFHLRCEGGVSFRGTQVEAGGILLNGGSISNQLLLTSADIAVGEGEDEDGVSLKGTGLEVGEEVWFDDITTHGHVDLSAATLEADFDLRSAVVQGVLLLDGASIGGDLKLLDASLGRGDGPAIVARRLTVGGDMKCQDANSRKGGIGLFRASGEMHLPAAAIKGRLIVSGAILEGSAGLGDYGMKVALTLTGGRIDELILCPARVEGLVDLRDLTVTGLRDVEGDKFYGLHCEQLRLDGFAYGALREPLDAKTRLRWIGRAQAQVHNPGVFLRLAEEFHRIGRVEDARDVMIADQRRTYRELKKTRRSIDGVFRKVPLILRQAWHNLLYVTVGYGYRNWLALGWLIGLLALGSSLFWFLEGSFHPADRHAPDFQPLLYAIDVTVPVIDLGQQEAWVASSGARWLVLAFAVGGYALATAVVAAAAGLLARGDQH